MNVPQRESSARERTPDVRSELEELCRLHDVNLRLIERSDDVEELLSAVLDEYEQRLEDLPTESLGNTSPARADAQDDPRLKNLMRFAGQAVALKARAENTALLRRQAEELETTNRRLQTALSETAEAVERLDGVLDAIDSGIVILGRDGKVKRANRSALELTGEGELEGQSAARFIGSVEPMGDGEIAWEGSGRRRRVLLVSRRSVCTDSGDEVVLIHDVTERDRVVEERHRRDKTDALLRSVGVLAHKINNPLTALLGRAQMLSSGSSQDAKTHRSIEVIDESARRIAELIRELAAVVKTGDIEQLERALRIDGASVPPDGGRR